MFYVHYIDFSEIILWVFVFKYFPKTQGVSGFPEKSVMKVYGSILSKKDTRKTAPIFRPITFLWHWVGAELVYD